MTILSRTDLSDNNCSRWSQGYWERAVPAYGLWATPVAHRTGGISVNQCEGSRYLFCTMFEQFGLNRAGFSSASSSCIPSCFTYTYLPFLLSYFLMSAFCLLANSRALLLFCLEFCQQKKNIESQSGKPGKSRPGRRYWILIDATHDAPFIQEGGLVDRWPGPVWVFWIWGVIFPFVYRCRVSP